VGPHQVANLSGRSVRDYSLESLAGFQAYMCGIGISLASRDQQHDQACIPAGVADLSLGPHSPLAANGQSHLGGIIITDGRERYHRDFSAGCSPQPLDQIFHSC
jgi:hypothetical protein